MKIASKMCFIVSILMIVSVFSTCNQKGNSSKMAEIDVNDTNYLWLHDAKIFSEGPVGIAGETPPEVTAFGTLLHKPNAKEYFVKLESDATNAGKLYVCADFILLTENITIKSLKNMKQVTKQ